MCTDTGDLLSGAEGYEAGGMPVPLQGARSTYNAINIINAVLMRKSAIAQLTK